MNLILTVLEITVPVFALAGIGYAWVRLGFDYPLQFVTRLAMTLALFSLAGIPPFAGFFSKFFIFAAAFKEGFHLLVFIALLNTVISLYYYLLVVKAMFLPPGEHPVPPFRSDRGTRLSLALCTAGVLLLGIASVVYDSIGAFAFGM